MLGRTAARPPLARHLLSLVQAQVRGRDAYLAVGVSQTHVTVRHIGRSTRTRESHGAGRTRCRGAGNVNRRFEVLS
jgi:hypothetical protein